MRDRLGKYWAPRMLYRLSMLSAAGLALAWGVSPVVAPLLDDPPPLLTLFATDVVVRRVLVAAVIGLIVAGLVFFRPQIQETEPSKASPSPPKKPPFVRSHAKPKPASEKADHDSAERSDDESDS